jgi:hypothetical protein
MFFIEGTLNDKQYLLILTSDRKEGVIISEEPFLGKLLPILIKEGKITEMSPMWGAIRKALVGGKRIRDFKEWLLNKIQGDPDEYEDATLNLLEDTVVFEKKKLDIKNFKNIFFSDEEHMSTSIFYHGDEESTRQFRTARGTRWLAKHLLIEGYGVYLEEETLVDIFEPEEMSLDDIFSKHED